MTVYQYLHDIASIQVGTPERKTTQTGVTYDLVTLTLKNSAGAISTIHIMSEFGSSLNVTVDQKQEVLS